MGIHEHSELQELPYDAGLPPEQGDTRLGSSDKTASAVWIMERYAEVLQKLAGLEFDSQMESAHEVARENSEVLRRLAE